MISNKIHLLPEHLIDQIKAGEVIERPASIIKELLENSIDAGSDKINIQIRDNGLELISIEDNGHGMGFEDLPYAFCRHATSKIERFEDIYSLHSYGFRGEALASMASIARITCTSTPAENLNAGGKIIIHGGETKAHSEHQGRRAGTSFYIKDLFYNTPARLKFIKSKTSEKNSLKRVLNAFILSNPHVTFSLKWDDKEKDIYRKSDDGSFEKRAKQILFKKKAEEHEKVLLEISGAYEDYRISGYVSQYSSRGNAGKNQYLFINGRLFTDRQIHQTIIRNMEKLWPMGESGHYFVMLTTPPSGVDVNVHPNKTQVKFFKPSLVFSMVSAAIKKTISEYREKMGGSTNLLSSLQNEQRELFSDEVNKGLALENFSQTPFSLGIDLNQSQSSYGYQDSNQHSSFQQKETNSLSTDYIKLSSGFSLMRDENSNQMLLLNHSLIMGQYLGANFSIKESLQEKDTTPLLISEPFELAKGKIDQFFEVLQHVGLEVDRLDEDVVALRSIPNFLNEFPIRETLSPFFRDIQKYNELSIEDVSEYFFNQYRVEFHSHIEMELKLMCKRLSMTTLLSSKAIVPLSDKNLWSLFNE